MKSCACVNLIVVAVVVTLVVVVVVAVEVCKPQMPEKRQQRATHTYKDNGKHLHMKEKQSHDMCVNKPEKKNDT